MAALHESNDNHTSNTGKGDVGDIKDACTGRRLGGGCGVGSGGARRADCGSSSSRGRGGSSIGEDGLGVPAESDGLGEGGGRSGRGGSGGLASLLGLGHGKHGEDDSGNEGEKLHLDG